MMNALAHHSRQAHRWRQLNRLAWCAIMGTALALALSGCGTRLQPTGTTHAKLVYNPATGAIHAEYADGKDRAGADLSVTFPDGTTMTLTTTESDGSTAQAAVMGAAISKIPTVDDLRGLMLMAPGV